MLLSCIAQTVGNRLTVQFTQAGESSCLKQVSQWCTQMTEQLGFWFVPISVLSRVVLYCISSIKTDLTCPLFADKSSCRSAVQRAQHLWLTLHAGEQ